MPKRKSRSPAAALLTSSVTRIIAVALFIGLLVAGLSRTTTDPSLASCGASLDPQALSGDYDPTATIAYFDGRSLSVPAPKPDDRQLAQVLGEGKVLGEKRIEVDLTNQRLYAYEDDTRVFEFLVSTGKPWWATPTGEFRPWTKLRYTRMRGGSREAGTYYDLPNVPHTMFFYNDEVSQSRGYAIHGAYWHNFFGSTRSHGCVNLSLPDAEKLFQWTEAQTADNPGTLIRIYGQTPTD